MSITSIAAVVAMTFLITLCAQAHAAGAAAYQEAVRGDGPVIRQSFDDQLVPGATPSLGRAARHAGVVGASDRIKPDGDFTVEWWQFVPSIETAGPTLRIGDYAFGVRPLPKAKPKDPSRAVFGADESLRSKTLTYPGRWYYVAFVVRGGAGQFFINGQSDGESQKLTGKAGSELRIEPGAEEATGTLFDEVAAYDRTLSAEQLQAHFIAALPPRKIVTVGHRGDNRFAPENTRVSYMQAIDKRAPVVEMDLRLTKDDVLVLLHDATVDRTTGRTGKVNIVDLTVDDARKLDAGSWKDPIFKGEPIPRVADLCELCRGRAVMMLDLKCTGLGKALAELKKQTKFPSNEWILAPWEDEEGVALRQHLPDVPMIRLTTKLPTDNFDDAYFARMKQIGFSGFSVSWPHLTQAFIDAARAHGFTIYTWTVNDPPDVAGATLANVDGIITDDPAATMKLIAELTAGDARK
jgi:glycerophosphoryl diester phosphodiesterase